MILGVVGAYSVYGGINGSCPMPDPKNHAGGEVP